MNKVRAILLIAAPLLLVGCGKRKYPLSEVIFEDVYYLEDAENMEFVFGADSTMVVSQQGIYELDENEDGDVILRICLDDIVREMPEDYNFTDYLVRKEDGRITLTFTTEEFNLDANPMMLFPLKGEDGLLSGELFDGTYQIGEDGDSYQYIFGEDGSVIMRIEEYYYARKDGRMTLRDHAGSTKYLYEVSGDKLMIKNRKGGVIMTLRKDTAQD